MLCRSRPPAIRNMGASAAASSEMISSTALTIIEFISALAILLLNGILNQFMAKRYHRIKDLFIPFKFHVGALGMTYVMLDRIQDFLDFKQASTN